MKNFFKIAWLISSIKAALNIWICVFFSFPNRPVSHLFPILLKLGLIEVSIELLQVALLSISMIFMSYLVHQIPFIKT